MPSAPDLNVPPPPQGSRPATRWVALIVVSLLVHLAILDVLPRLSWRVTDPDEAADPADTSEPLRTRLVPMTPPAPVAPAPLPAPASAVAAAPRAAAAPPATPRRAPSRPVPPPAFVPQGIDAPIEVATAVPPAPAPAPPAASPPPVAPQPTAVPATDAVAAAISPPRSARLDYLVLSQKIREANPVYGVGTIDWSASDGRYVIEMQADLKVAFASLNLLKSHSEGALTDVGLEPARYIESPRFKAAIAVNFNRDERRSVTFSASQAVAPLLPGIQDRSSILFQLGGLLLGDPKQALAGMRFDVPVASMRGEVDLWNFESFGKEVVETPHGSLPSTHLRRVPKPGSNDRIIDVWVTDDGGYPARVVQTEKDGSTVTMTLERVSAVQ